MAAILLHASLDVALTAEKRLNNQVVNPGPQQVHINPNLLQMFAESAQTPLIAEVILFASLISNKFIIFLIDCVVSQVHVFVLLVYFLGVCLRGESSKAFLMNVNSQRFVTSNSDVDSQVEFMAVDQQRVRDVLTDD